MLWFLVIWLAWKGWIWFIGIENQPISTRHLPALSAAWEAFNGQLKVLLLYLTEGGLNAMGYKTYQSGVSLWIIGYKGISVGNYCLGLQLMFYHVALMFISPLSLWQKVTYAVLGVLLIELLNVGRMVGLLLISVYKPSLLVLSHDYLFMIPVLGLTLLFYYCTTIHRHGN